MAKNATLSARAAGILIFLSLQCAAEEYDSDIRLQGILSPPPPTLDPLEGTIQWRCKQFSLASTPGKQAALDAAKNLNLPPEAVDMEYCQVLREIHNSLNAYTRIFSRPLGQCRVPTEVLKEQMDAIHSNIIGLKRRLQEACPLAFVVLETQADEYAWYLPLRSRRVRSVMTPAWNAWEKSTAKYPDEDTASMEQSPMDSSRFNPDDKGLYLQKIEALEYIAENQLPLLEREFQHCRYAQERMSELSPSASQKQSSDKIQSHLASLQGLGKTSEFGKYYDQSSPGRGSPLDIGVNANPEESLNPSGNGEKGAGLSSIKIMKEAPSATFEALTEGIEFNGPDTVEMLGGLWSKPNPDKAVFQQALRHLYDTPTGRQILKDIQSMRLEAGAWVQKSVEWAARNPDKIQSNLDKIRGHIASAETPEKKALWQKKLEEAEKAVAEIPLQMEVAKKDPRPVVVVNFSGDTLPLTSGHAERDVDFANGKFISKVHIDASELDDGEINEKQWRNKWWDKLSWPEKARQWPNYLILAAQEKMATRNPARGLTGILGHELKHVADKNLLLRSQALGTNWPADPGEAEWRLSLPWHLAEDRAYLDESKIIMEQLDAMHGEPSSHVLNNKRKYLVNPALRDPAAFRLAKNSAPIYLWNVSPVDFKNPESALKAKLVYMYQAFKNATGNDGQNLAQVLDWTGEFHPIFEEVRSRRLGAQESSAFVQQALQSKRASRWLKKIQEAALEFKRLTPGEQDFSKWRLEQAEKQFWKEYGEFVGKYRDRLQ